MQAGLDGETDSQTVARLAGVPVLPEAWRLTLAASPHRAAAEEGVLVDAAALTLPPTRPAAGGGRGGRADGAADAAALSI